MYIVYYLVLASRHTKYNAHSRYTARLGHKYWNVGAEEYAPKMRLTECVWMIPGTVDPN